MVLLHPTFPLSFLVGNARLFYNRTVAYEYLGEHKKADADYARALSDDAAIIRILAREHDEVTEELLKR